MHSLVFQSDFKPKSLGILGRCVVVFGQYSNLLDCSQHGCLLVWNAPMVLPENEIKDKRELVTITYVNSKYEKSVRTFQRIPMYHIYIPTRWISRENIFQHIQRWSSHTIHSWNKYFPRDSKNRPSSMENLLRQTFVPKFIPASFGKGRVFFIIIIIRSHGKLLDPTDT